MSNRRDPATAIVADYRTVVRAMDRLVLPALIDRDVTMAQFRALIALSTVGSSGIAITELGLELSIGQSWASLLADQLTRAGYGLRRQDDNDRRRVLVQITPEGDELVANLRQGRSSTLLEWIAHLGPDEAEALGQGMRALAREASAERE